MAIPALEIEITADPSKAQAGIKTVERSLGKLDKLTQEYSAGQVAAARSVTGFAGSFGGLSAALNRNKTVFQQAGYQIGDFAIQVGAGQSALVAFSQQSSQLLGVFGAWGAVAGAAVAILAPLGAAFLSAGGSAKTLQENLDALADALDAVNSAQDAAMTSMTDLRQRYGEYADSVQEVLAAQREIAAFEAELALADTVGQLAEQFGDLRSTVDDMGTTIIPGAEEAFRRILRTMDASSEQAYELVQSLKSLADAQGPEAQRAALERVRTALLDATGGVKNMDEETRNVYRSMLEAEAAAARVAVVAATMADPIGDAADEAGRLKRELQAAAAVDYARRSGRYSGRGGDPRQFDPEGRLSLTPGAAPFLPGQDIVAAADEILNPSKRGGGGGSKSKAEETIGALAKSLMTQSELLENWRTESLEKLADFNAKELEALGGHAEAKLRIEEEYQKRLADVQKAERAAKIGALTGAFGDLSSLMQSENKKLFNIGKAASIANATISGYEAAVDAWQKGMKIGGTPVAAAFTAASLAKTGMLISQIASQSIGGGGGGGGRGGGAGAAAATSVSTLDVNLTVQGRGDLATSPGAVDSLTDMLLKNFKDRGLDVVRVRA